MTRTIVPSRRGIRRSIATCVCLLSVRLGEPISLGTSASVLTHAICVGSGPITTAENSISGPTVNPRPVNLTRNDSDSWRLQANAMRTPENGLRPIDDEPPTFGDDESCRDCDRPRRGVRGSRNGEGQVVRARWQRDLERAVRPEVCVVVEPPVRNICRVRGVGDELNQGPAVRHPRHIHHATREVLSADGGPQVR